MKKTVTPTLACLFKNKNFIRFFWGKLTGIIAVSLEYIVLVSWLVFFLNQNEKTIAIFSLLYFSPLIFLSPFFGIFLEYCSLRFILYGSMFLSAILTFILILFINNLAIMFVIVFLASCCNVLFLSAEISFIKKALQVEQLVQANSLTRILDQVTKILCSTAGAICLIWFSLKTVLFIISLLFFVSSGFLFLISETRNKVFLEKSISSVTSTFTSKSKDVLYVCCYDKNIFFCMASFLFMSLSFALAKTFIPLLVKDLEFTNTTFGMAMTFSGIGGIIGALIMPSFAKIKPSSLIITGLLISSLGIMIGSTVTQYIKHGGLYLFLAAWFAASFGSSMISISTILTLQYNLTSSMIGGVYSIRNIIEGASYLVSPMIGAYMIPFLGTKLLFVIAGGVLCIYTIIIFVYNRVKVCNLREEVAEDEI